MSNASGRKRQSKGTPVGGQFAAENRNESDIDLSDSTNEDTLESLRQVQRSHQNRIAELKAQMTRAKRENDDAQLQAAGFPAGGEIDHDEDQGCSSQVCYPLEPDSIDDDIQIVFHSPRCEDESFAHFDPRDEIEADMQQYRDNRIEPILAEQEFNMYVYRGDQEIELDDDVAPTSVAQRNGFSGFKIDKKNIGEAIEHLRNNSEAIRSNDEDTY